MFFGSPFVVLHEEVLTHLAADTTIHACLPLLAVSRYWRSLVIRKLVGQFARTETKSDEWLEVGKHFEADLGPGEFLKVVATSFCPEEGAQDTEDPRYYFTKEGKNRESILLTLQHFDPKTMLCTFLPAIEELKIAGFLQLCNESGRPYPDAYKSFAIVSSAWFRPAKGKKWDSELAAAPERFPPCGAEIWAEVSDNKNSRVEEEDKKLHWKDWTASYHTLRIDIDGYRQLVPGMGERVECILAVHDITLPLLDLYRPSKTYSEKQYHESYY
ncbi:hypothetical protein RQP46_002642 [Phenoliferia psychrophenolica]